MKAFARSVAATALLAASVTAQYAIDPNSVSNSTRQYWCQEQLTECPLICLQPPANSAETLSNTCDWQSLTYSCVCADGLSPNISEYSQTLPYFICTEWGVQCVSNCGGDNTCAAACQQDHPCGALNPQRVNASTMTSTSMSSATPLGTGSGATVDTAGQTIYTGFANGDAAQTGSPSSGGGSMGGGSTGAASQSIILSTGKTFGTLAVFGVMSLCFAVFL